jgi:gamma-glutamylcysteine synthetase
MDVDALLKRYLTERVEENKKRHVGMEMELPLIRQDDGAPDMRVIRKMFEMLRREGFEKQTFAPDGDPISATDTNGNKVTFDTSYATLEYVTTSAPSMIGLYQRYFMALRAMQHFLQNEGHALLGIGLNPSPGAMEAKLINVDLTLSIRKFLGARDFYRVIASEQVHFNTCAAELARLINVFTHVDVANVVLFANSPALLHGKHLLCARHALYRRSRFSELGLTGAQPLDAKDVDALIREYRKLKMFRRMRGGISELIEPTTIEEYFGNPIHGAIEDDIWSFDIERNIITTNYGTVEYRTLCTQPFGEQCMPSAFCLGLRQDLDALADVCGEFYKKHDLPQDENALIAMAERDGKLEDVSEPAMAQWLKALLDLSIKGLKKRGYGEEAFLAPLIARKNIAESPAKRYTADAAKHGLKEAVRHIAVVPEEGLV